MPTTDMTTVTSLANDPWLQSIRDEEREIARRRAEERELDRRIAVGEQLADLTDRVAELTARLEALEVDR